MAAYSPELNTIAALSGQRPTREVKAGDVIYSAGDPGEFLYGVVKGTITLSWGADLQETLGPGSSFGAGALLDPEHRRFDTAIAASDVELLEMDRAEFLFAVQELPLFGLEMLHDLEGRLHRLKNSIADA